jgi:hypothetical protein
VWYGYDPQSGYNYFFYQGPTITGNTVAFSGGHCIAMFASPIMPLVEGNACTQWGLQDSTSTDTSGGVYLGLNYYTPIAPAIRGNTLNSSNGVGIVFGYPVAGSVTENTISAPYGIETFSVSNSDISRNFINMIYANSVAYGIKNINVGSNISTGLLIDSNTINAATGSQGIWQQDVQTSGVDIRATNRVFGSPANAVREDAAANPGTDIVSFSAYMAATPSISSGGIMAFDTVLFDTSGTAYYYAVATGKYTPTIAGTYQVSTSVCLSGTATAGGTIKVNILKGGAGGYGVASGLAPTVTTSPLGCLSTSSLVKLNGSTDYVEVEVSYPGSVTVVAVVASNSTFSAEKVAP